MVPSTQCSSVLQSSNRSARMPGHWLLWRTGGSLPHSRAICWRPPSIPSSPGIHVSTSIFCHWLLDTRAIMSTRALDLLDLPTLHRYRNEVMGFDATRAVTRGNPLGAMGLMFYINPLRRIYAAISEEENSSSLFGGVFQTRGESFAKLLYLAPASRLEDRALPALLENLAGEAGNWGAFHVVAEVDENCAAFPSLREAGFS